MSAPNGIPIGPAPGWRPQEADRWGGSGLWWALGAHALLLLGLALSVNWKMSDPAPIEAEMWSEIPQIAGGAAPPPPPPVQREVPRPAPVEADEPEPEPVRKPDLVVEKTRPKKEEPRKVEPKREEPKPEPKKPEVKKVEPKKEAPKKDLPKDEPKKDVPKTPPAKPVPSKQTDAQSRSVSAAELEAQRQANLKRMMSSLGGEGAGAGNAARSSGPSAGYAGRIIARVKPNIRLIEQVDGNPQAVVEVQCAPDGRIISRRLVKSSGVAVWDETVLRALDRTEVLPADVDGRVPSPMQLSFKLRDF